MSDILRQHISAFGFSHSEIARRAAKLNQATAYRVVEGETINPSLKSITGIVEAVSLTDADAGVLYRRMGTDVARPRRHQPPEGISTHEEAANYAKNHLDSGRLREAAYGVMAMFDLAIDDEQLCDSYEQAGILYMGLGRWEEAQVNFEAADAHLKCNVDDPTLPQILVNRKHTLMTNIGSLMIKRGNASWAILFANAVSTHPRSSHINRGWAFLVAGEADLELSSHREARDAFAEALRIFEGTLATAQAMPGKLADGRPDANRNRRIHQARGNIRWTRVHLAKSLLLLGKGDASSQLQDMEADWMSLDPESSMMAGLFHAESLKNDNRRQLRLLDIEQRAKRHGLGEIVQRIALLLCMAMLVLNVAVHFNSWVVQNEEPLVRHVAVKRTPSPDISARGNTGG